MLNSNLIMKAPDEFEKTDRIFWHDRIVDKVLIVVILAVCFFIGASAFNFLSQEKNFVKWLSPDETSNYIFTKLYVETGELKIFEKYNLVADDIIHPRSMRSDYGSIKPVSFLGIILIYGKIASFVGAGFIPYLTPLFASIGIIYFYLLVKKLFGHENALISSFLLASFPPFIYYSARSMFHNVLFVVLLIIGLYYAYLMAKRKGNIGWLYSSLAGGFLGLAIITRTSEIIWFAPLLFILWIFNIKKVSLVKATFFLGFLFLSLMPAFYWNNVLHDAPLGGGYPEAKASIQNVSQFVPDFAMATIAGDTSHYGELFKKLKDNIFYFGVNPRQSTRMFYYYFIEMFPWIFWPAVFGFLLFIPKIKKWKRGVWAFLASYLIFSLVLLFYYGSWGFHDNPDPKRFTIGNSYTRYWLPIYLGALPFASLFIIKLTGLFKKSFYIWAGRIVIIGLIFFVSIGFVAFASEEGLMFSLDVQRESKAQLNEILGLTENNSIIITRYHDKVFFPERKIIVGLFDDDEMIKRYSRLAKFSPIYYYNFALEKKDFDYLNDSKLKKEGLAIEEIKKVTREFTLYKLYEK